MVALVLVGRVEGLRVDGKSFEGFGFGFGETEDFGMVIFLYK